MTHETLNLYRFNVGPPSGTLGPTLNPHWNKVPVFAEYIRILDPIWIMLMKVIC